MAYTLQETPCRRTVCKAFCRETSIRMKSYFRFFQPFLCLVGLIFFQNLLPAQIVNIEDQRIKSSNDSTKWYGHLNFGANVSKVKDNILQFNSTGQVQYRNGHNLILILLDFRSLRAGNQDFNRAGFGHLRYNRDLWDRLVWEAYGQAQYNKLLLMRLRALVGSGPRYRILKSNDGKQRMYAGLALLFEHNQFLENIEDKNWWRMSSYLSFTLWPWDGVKLVSTTYFQPQVDDFENFRMSTECALNMPLNKRLSFSTTFRFSLDRSLPLDAPESTYAWLNGLTFRF